MTSLSDDQLALARRHVVEGEARRARQAALIRRLKAQGFDTTEAERLLANIDATLMLMHEHQERLQAEQNKG